MGCLWIHISVYSGFSVGKKNFVFRTCTCLSTCTCQSPQVYHFHITCFSFCDVSSVSSRRSESLLFFLSDSIRRRANARNGSQFTLSTHFIKPNYLVILPRTQHRGIFKKLTSYLFMLWGCNNGFHGPMKYT